MSTTRGRQNTSRFNPFLALMLIVLAAVGTIVTLEATGKTELGLAKLWGGEVKAAPRGTLVLFSVRALKPGDLIDESAVVDRKLQRVHKVPLNISLEVATERGYVTGFDEIKGRVVGEAMGANQPFVTSELLPEGTHPGIVGLVPEGRQLVMLDAKKVQGVEALGFRNRFDLKASRPVSEEIARAAKDALEARPHVSPEDRMALASTPKAPERLLLAQNGMIISRAEKQGNKTMVAVALDPADVDLVIDALAGDETIYCVAHTGLSQGEMPRIQPERVDPIAPYRWLLESMNEVEIYKGNERTIGVVPVSDRLR